MESQPEGRNRRNVRKTEAVPALPGDGLLELVCISVLESALTDPERPEIFKTDEGSQYTGQAFTDVLRAHDIQISMDSKGRATNNIRIRARLHQTQDQR